MRSLSNPLRAAVLSALLLASTVLVAVAVAEGAPAEIVRPRGPFSNIHVIDFDGDIEAIMFAYVRRRVEAAQADGADCIVLRIESPGGTIYHGRKIGDLLFDLPDSIHVVAWVPKMALSGAAFVSLACDEILLGRGATIGDAQPIMQGVGGKPDPIGEKIESPLRAWFSTYAETNGYPVLLAQAMVSERMEVIRVRPKAGGEAHYLEGEEFRAADDAAELVAGIAKRDLVQIGPPVVGKDELLTMTSKEALEYGFVARRFEGDGLPANEEAVLGALKAPDARMTQARMSFSENASKWLMTVAGILSAIVAMAVLVFIWQGPGLMTIVGGVALVLVVLINVTADQLHGFPIFLILLGIGLLAAEVFLIPGFGIPGILGIASMGAGFLFLATGTTPGDTAALDSQAVVSFGLQFVFTAIAGFGTLMLMSRFVPRIGPARHMVLQAPDGSLRAAALAKDSGAASTGMRGVTRSPLRPAGSAEFDGVLTDVVSDGTFIPAGVTVCVTAVEGDRVTVRMEDSDA